MKHGTKVTYQNRTYDYGYIGSQGHLIIYHEGECNMQDGMTVNPEEVELADPHVSFGKAIEKLREDVAMAREGWIERGLWIVLDTPEHEAPRFMIEDSNSKRRDRWQPSHTDMLATDWCEVERPDEASEWEPTR